MTTSRDVFQQSCCAAIDRYDEAIGNKVPRRTAHPILLDQLVKAWDRSMLERAQYAQRGVPAPKPKRQRAPRSPQEAAARINGQAAS